MSKIKQFSIAQARIQAKELQKSIKSGKADSNTILRLRILPEYSALQPDDITSQEPKLSKCQHVIAKEAGFNDWQALLDEFFWQELTHHDLDNALKNEPRLTPFGMGVFDEGLKSLQQVQKEIQEDRNNFHEHFREFIIACKWLSKQQKIKTINRKRGSYGLKHRIEEWGKKANISNPYVCNGAFIAAAIHMGFTIKLLHSESPNVCLNISNRLSYDFSEYDKLI